MGVGVYLNGNNTVDLPDGFEEGLDIAGVDKDDFSSIRRDSTLPDSVLAAVKPNYGELLVNTSLDYRPREENRHTGLHEGIHFRDLVQDDVYSLVDKAGFSDGSKQLFMEHLNSGDVESIEAATERLTQMLDPQGKSFEKVFYPYQVMKFNSEAENRGLDPESELVESIQQETEDLMDYFVDQEIYGVELNDDTVFKYGEINGEEYVATWDAEEFEYGDNSDITGDSYLEGADLADYLVDSSENEYIPVDEDSYTAPTEDPSMIPEKFSFSYGSENGQCSTCG